MATVKQAALVTESVFPPRNVCMQDYIGLMTGSYDAAVEKALVCLDCTESVVEEAERGGFGLIISHHPLIFGTLSRVTDETPVGKIIMRAIKSGISVYSAHTNADCTKGGLNHYLAEALGIKDVSGLVEINEEASLGVVGTLEKTVTFTEFAKSAGAVLGDKYIKLYGKDKPVRKVALVTGAGGDAELVEAAVKADADCYVTGEVRHHAALYAAAYGLSIMEIGHYTGEHIFIPRFAAMLQAEADRRNIAIKFTAAESETNPAL